MYTVMIRAEQTDGAEQRQNDLETMRIIAGKRMLAIIYPSQS